MQSSFTIPWTLLGPDGGAIWRVLLDAREHGLCQRIGISAYYEQDPLALATRFTPDLMQLPLSLLDQRLIREGTLARLKDHGVALHARSLFLQGLPFLPHDKLPPRLRSAAPRLDEIRRAIASHGLTLVEALVAYVLNQPEIDMAIVGVTGVAELNEIAAAARRCVTGLAWETLAINDPVVLTPMLWNAT